MIPALLICLTLVFAAWAYGTTEAWALHAVQGATLLAAVVALSDARRAGRFDSETVALAWNWRWGGPLLALCAYVLVQALNASYSFSPGDEGLTPRRHLPFLPSSVASAASLGALGKLGTYAAVWWVVRVVAVSRSRRHLLASLVVVAGAAMAVLVTLQRTDRPCPPWPMTGRFVNENNYAAYANLLIPVALALARATHWRARVLMERSHPGYLLYGAAGLLIVSVFLSGSRAGILVCAVVVAGGLLLELVRPPHGGRRPWLPLAASLIVPLALAGAVFHFLGFARFHHELASMAGLESGLGGRAALLRALAAMYRDRWFFGTGAGTFACAFPYYQPGSLHGLYFLYAHNDWLQYAIELGAVGSLLLLGLMAGAVWPRRQTGPRTVVDDTPEAQTRRRVSVIGRGIEARGLALALAGVGLHAVVDFPLHIPAIAATAAAWAGLLGRVRPSSGRRRSRAARHGEAGPGAGRARYRSPAG